MISFATKVIPHNSIEFLQRFVGNQAHLIDEAYFPINEHMQCKLSKVQIAPSDATVEEKAIINFYPINTNDFYLVISYFVEDYQHEGHIIQIVQVEFKPSFFQQYDIASIKSLQPFQGDKIAEQAFSIHPKSRDSFEYLIGALNGNLDFLKCLDIESAILSLLKYAINAFVIPDEANSYPACSFLNNSQEREKILLAKSIINNHLTNPLTIRELSRECGINECYLKKGFKAMFGKTIHEYREHRRIEKSKELILDGKYNINEVATEMGYTSHAYFSTAFKKIAGIKPCDLLA